MASTSPAPVLDEFDHQLLDLLIRDGRITTRALAQEVGLTDATVSGRLRRLIGEGFMSVGPQFDWCAAGFRSQAVARICVEGVVPSALGKRLAVLPGVYYTTVTSGDADLVLVLLTADDRQMGQLIADVRNSRGVVSVRVDHILDVACHKPYAAQLPFIPISVGDLPDPCIQLDQLDREIITCLQSDGRASAREIARKTSVSDVTVRSRLTRMEQAGFLRVAAFVDPWRTQQVAAVAHIAFTVTGDVRRTVKEVVALPAVTYCATASGSHDIVAGIAARTENRLIQMVTESLWQLKGVRSVRAWRIAETLGQRSDLVRLV